MRSHSGGAEQHAGHHVSHYWGADEIIPNRNPPDQRRMEALAWWASETTAIWEQARGIAGQRRRMIRFVRLRVEFVGVSSTVLAIDPRRGFASARSFHRFRRFVYNFSATRYWPRSIWRRMYCFGLFYERHMMGPSLPSLGLTMGGLCVSEFPRRDFGPLSTIK